MVREDQFEGERSGAGDVGVWAWDARTLEEKGLGRERCFWG